MFSSRQLIFAIIFIIAFTGIIVFSYKKDKKSLPSYYKGSYKILIGFFIAIGFMVFVKYITTK
jgi:cbb3-type cytochrome oxidase subunit 3